MSESANRSRATEASQWFTIMTRPDVDPKDLERFRVWRRDPENGAAFAKVKATWQTAGGLAGRPALAAATEAALAAHPPRPATMRPSRRFVLKPLAVGLAGLAVVAVGYGAWRQREPTYVTEVGGQRLEVLADGTRVRLNTDTRLRVAFHDGVRRVVLERGQAFFDVAHDAARPFLVTADGAEVRALGTRFDVRRDGEAVRVTLVEGRVEVRTAGGAQAVLAPGEGVVADPQGVSRPMATNAEAVASWTTGRLTFSGVPLREAVAEMNRYSERKIILKAPKAIAREPVSGQFVTGDVETFAAGAGSLYGLKVTSETPREIRLAPG